jgi:hypothetical protein
MDYLLSLLNRAELAPFVTYAAFHTLALVDMVRAFLLTGYGSGGAVSRTERAAVTLFLVDVENSQCLAYSGRTFLANNMGFILFTKVL